MIEFLNEEEKKECANQHGGYHWNSRILSLYSRRYWDSIPKEERHSNNPWTSETSKKQREKIDYHARNTKVNINRHKNQEFHQREKERLQKLSEELAEKNRYHKKEVDL